MTAATLMKIQASILDARAIGLTSEQMDGMESGPAATLGDVDRQSVLLPLMLTFSPIRHMRNFPGADAVEPFSGNR